MTIQNGTIVLERRTMNRLTNTISVSDISNVNLEQNLLERLFRTYKLKIDTNSSSTAQKCDLKIVLKKEMAYAVKKMILQMMKESREDSCEEEKTEGILQEEEREDYDIVYDSGEIFRNVVLQMNFVAILILFGIFMFVFQDMIFDGKRSLLLRLGATFLTGLLSLQQVFSIWNNSFGFRCRRDNDKIYISAGFLKKKQYTIPVKKINSIQIHYSLLGRLCNCPSMKVINIGGEEEETAGTQLLLAAPYSKLKAQLQYLLPEAQIPETADLIRQPKRVLVKKCIYILLSTIAASWIFVWARAQFFPQVSPLAVCLFGALGIYWLITAVCRSHTAGFALTKDALISEEGCFSKTIRFIPYTKMQNIRFHHGPVEALLGVESSEVYILADLSNSLNTLSAFPKEEVEKLAGYFRGTYS